jgi:hypothetical protein
MVHGKLVSLLNAYRQYCSKEALLLTDLAKASCLRLLAEVELIPGVSVGTAGTWLFDCRSQSCRWSIEVVEEASCSATEEEIVSANLVSSSN